MIEADIIAAIRKTHLMANIEQFEHDAEATMLWDQATVDPGGALFGPGPYLKVPILDRDGDRLVVRVYAPEKLRRRLAKAWKQSFVAQENPT